MTSDRGSYHPDMVVKTPTHYCSGDRFGSPGSATPVAALEVDDVVKDLRRGLSCVSIARNHGVSDVHVGRFLKRNGVDLSSVRVKLRCVECGVEFHRKQRDHQIVRCRPCQKLRNRTLHIDGVYRSMSKRRGEILVELRENGVPIQGRYVNFTSPGSLGTLTATDLEAVKDSNGQDRVKARLRLVTAEDRYHRLERGYR